jgi:sarcosine oxidase
MSTRVDVAVIGAGAMGSAAAWRLARSGRSVVVLEQHRQGHLLGASHGATRNLSAAYLGTGYQHLLTEARSLWAELEDEAGVQLIDWVGLVQHGEQGPLRELRAVHERVGVRSELLDRADAESRWTGMRFAGPVLLTHDAGRIRAADSLRALRERAQAHGAVFEYERPVRRVELGTEPIVHTDAESYRCGHVVVTAGAWTRRVLPESVGLPPLRVTQEQPAHFAVRDDAHVWPNFMQEREPGDPRDDYWYGPVYGMLTPGEGLKAGWHGTGPEVDPDDRSFEYEPRQMDALRRYVEEWLPGADPDRFVPISCTYTTTPNEDFVIDRRGSVSVGAGFSGHGFKFTPVVGRILADLAAGGRSPACFRLPVAAPPAPH